MEMHGQYGHACFGHKFNWNVCLGKCFCPKCFFRLKGSWPSLLDILCCDAIPRSQQFHEFWFEAACFSNWRFSSTKKTICHSWKSVVVSHPIRTNFRLRFVHYKFCPNYLCFFCSAHWIMLLLQVASTTLHTFWELQHAFMLPKSAKIAWIQNSALMLTKIQTNVQADNHKRLEVHPEGRSRNRKFIYIYIHKNNVYTYIHTYIQTDRQTDIHAISSK